MNMFTKFEAPTPNGISPKELIIDFFSQRTPDRHTAEELYDACDKCGSSAGNAAFDAAIGIVCDNLHLDKSALEVLITGTTHN